MHRVISFFFVEFRIIWRKVTRFLYVVHDLIFNFIPQNNIKKLSVNATSSTYHQHCSCSTLYWLRGFFEHDNYCASGFEHNIGLDSWVSISEHVLEECARKQIGGFERKYDKCIPRSMNWSEETPSNVWTTSSRKNSSFFVRILFAQPILSPHLNLEGKISFRLISSKQNKTKNPTFSIPTLPIKS